MRRRRSRARRFLKWAGLVLCLLIATAWAVSLRWSVYAHGSVVSVTLWEGQIPLLDGWDPFWDGYQRFSLIPVQRQGCCGFTWGGRLLVRSDTRSAVGWTAPLWAVLVVLAIPTAFLWWRDRRPPKDHCQNCGYDLTGNVSGVCPECGNPI